MNHLSRPAPVDLVVDSSALLSIFLGEDTAAEMADLLLGSSGAVVCAPILLESSMVALGRGGHEGLAALDEVVASSGIVTIPADQHLTHTDLARDTAVNIAPGSDRIMGH